MISAENNISFNEIGNSLSQNRPVVVACSNWGAGDPRGYNWSHISVIKGLDSGFLYFQDPILGEIAFDENIVRNSFNCFSIASAFR